MSSSTRSPMAAVQETPRVLDGGEPKTIDAPSFGFWGQPVCDSDENMYFRTGGSATELHIVRLTPGRDDNQVFEVPDTHKDVSMSTFSVSGDGHLWVAATVGLQAEIFEFSSSGEMTSEIKLDVYENFIPENLAVFSSGSMLVSGFFGGSADSAHKGRAFTGLFQSSGKLYKEIRPGDDDFSLSDLRKKPWAGGLTIGWDGNAYILRQDRIGVISPSGQQVRVLKFSKPEPSLFASRIDVSQGYISITLQKRPDKIGGSITSQYLVIDASDGREVGLYAPGATVGIAMLCFSRQNGFLFSAPVEGKTVPSHFGFVRAPLN